MFTTRAGKSVDPKNGALALAGICEGAEEAG